MGFNENCDVCFPPQYLVGWMRSMVSNVHIFEHFVHYIILLEIGVNKVGGHPMVKGC